MSTQYKRFNQEVKTVITFELSDDVQYIRITDKHDNVILDCKVNRIYYPDILNQFVDYHYSLIRYYGGESRGMLLDSAETKPNPDDWYLSETGYVYRYSEIQRSIKLQDASIAY